MRFISSVTRQSNPILRISLFLEISRAEIAISPCAIPDKPPSPRWAISGSNSKANNMAQLPDEDPVFEM